MCEIEGPLMFAPLETTETVHGDGSVTKSFIGLTNSESLPVLKAMTEEMGGRCQIGGPLSVDEANEIIDSYQGANRTIAKVKTRQVSHLAFLISKEIYHF